jgi:hypothetical protein
MKTTKTKGLNRKEMNELTDLLRRCVTYQTPKPVKLNDEDIEPTWFEARFPVKIYNRILHLVDKADGWKLSAREKEAVLRRHGERAKALGAVGTFNGVSYGDLKQMQKDTQDIEELEDVHEAVEAEIAIAENG